MGIRPRWASRALLWMDEILHHPRHHGRPLFVGIYQIRPLPGFIGGAKWISQPSAACNSIHSKSMAPGPVLFPAPASPAPLSGTGAQSEASKSGREVQRPAGRSKALCLKFGGSTQGLQSFFLLFPYCFLEGEHIDSLS